MPIAPRRLVRALTVVTAVVTLAAGAPAGAEEPTPESVRATSTTTSAALPDTLNVVGHGWGHGRGLGQYGSYGYATGITGEPWHYSRILAHYYGGTTVGHIEDRLMAVWLRNRPSNSAMVVYRADGLQIRGQADTPVAVRVTPLGNNRYNLQTGTSCGGPWSTNERIVSGPVRVAKKADSGDRALRLCYSGGSQIAYDDSTELVAIDDKTVNLVRMEEMLRGIVPQESPPSWGDAAGGAGINALRAQSVAARSYAAAGDTRWGDLHTRLGAHATTCDNTYCQVYGGIAHVSADGTITNRTYANTDRAIADTRLEVRRWPNGNVARTEFSSSTGGWTAGGGFAVVQDLGDAVSSNPNHRWTVSRTRQQIEAKYPSIGTLTDIQFLERNGLGDMGGRVVTMKLVGSAGEVTTSGNTFRSRLGLKSDWFDIDVPAPPPPPPPPPREPRSIDTACPAGSVPSAGFTDVADASPHARAIDCMAHHDVANGTSATRFSPERAVTREQMASFVARLIEADGHSLPSTPRDAFTDDEESVHELRINQLASMGIVKGTGDGLYDPKAPVDRAQMASILTRGLELAMGVDLVESPPDAFTDDDGSVHEASINVLAEEGVVAGTAPGAFDPGAEARRDQMASMLARALDLAMS